MRFEAGKWYIDEDVPPLGIRACQRFAFEVLSVNENLDELRVRYLNNPAGHPDGSIAYISNLTRCREVTQEELVAIRLRDFM